MFEMVTVLYRAKPDYGGHRLYTVSELCAQFSAALYRDLHLVSTASFLLPVLEILAFFVAAPSWVGHLS